MEANSVTEETIDSIMACSNNEEGIQLHHENGVKTDNLMPSHTSTISTPRGEGAHSTLKRNFKQQEIK